MFSKLRNFSEDVAKSFNDLNADQGQGNGQNRRVDATQELKKEEKILSTITPDASKLTQPEDELVEKEPVAVDEDKSKSPTNTEDNLNELPPIIRAKMKKFAKYEEKYPILLEAYKTEKRKGELIVMFEKVLQEHTPVSKISEAGLLIDYLKGLNNKTSMLNGEMRRYSKENTSLTKSNNELLNKVKNLENKLNELNVKLTKSEPILNKEEVEANSLTTSTFEDDSSKDSVVLLENKVKELSSQLEKAQQKLHEATKRIENYQASTEAANLKDEKALQEYETRVSDYEGKLASLKKEVTTLEQDVTSKSEEILTLQNKVSHYISENQLKTEEMLKSQESLKKAETEKAEYEHNIEELKSKIANLEAEVNELSLKLQESEDRGQSKCTNEDVVSANANGISSSNKNKKKKKKNKSKEVSSPTAQPIDVETEKDDLMISNNQDLQEKLKSSEEKVAALSIELSNIKEDNERLLNDYRRAKSELELKQSDVEDLRELLKDLGDDLVQSREELKNLRELKTDHSAKDELVEVKRLYELTISERDALKDSVENLKKSHLAKEKIASNFELQIESITKECDDLKKKFNTTTKEHDSKVVAYEADIKRLNESIEQEKSSTKALKDERNLSIKKSEDISMKLASINKEVEILKKEKSELTNRINDMNKFKSNDTSLKLEIASLKSTIEHKDRLIGTLQEEIEGLKRVREELSTSISKLRDSNLELMNNNKSLMSDKSSLVTKYERSVENSNTLSKDFSSLQTQKQSLASELEIVKKRYDGLVSEKSNNKGELETFKQQHEEILMKSKESLLKIENLEDELQETKNTLKEKSRQYNTVKSLLADIEELINSKEQEYKAELNRIKQERDESELASQNMVKRKQREIDELKSSYNSVSTQLEVIGAKNSELQKMVNILPQQKKDNSDSNSLEEFSKTIETMRNSLQSSSAKLAEYEKMNNILKKLNEESNLKFERLSKNYKVLSNQYRHLKDELRTSISSNNSSSDLVTVPTNGSADNQLKQDTNIAYLKNVLLGFFEHKEQRDQLLPVVKTLFNFTKEEEQKLLVALK